MDKILKIIAGRSGSGKTDWIIRDIQRVRKADWRKRIIFLVPEQYTNSTERELSERTDCHGILFTEVMSFTKLSFKIFSLLGHSCDVIMSEVAKSMLIRYIVAQITEGRLEGRTLDFFSGRAGSAGYVSRIKSFISELRQYGISAGRLDRAALKCPEKEKAVLSGKLKDISVIYREFEEYLKENALLTSDGVLDMAHDLLKKALSEGGCPIFEGASVYIDGFTGFTRQQHRLIELILSSASDVSISVTTDRENLTGERRDSLFNMSRAALDRLGKSASGQGIPVKVIWPGDGEPRRWRRNSDLAAMEAGIFRYGTAGRTKVKAENISIRVFKTPAEEIRHVTTAIRNLIAGSGAGDGSGNGGNRAGSGGNGSGVGNGSGGSGSGGSGKSPLRYRDIAVICGDMESYSRIARTAFLKAGIPVFIDSKKSMTGNAFTGFISSLIKVAARDFETQDVAAVLKSGFLTGGAEYEAAVDVTENFLLETGIRGYGSWNRPWVNCPAEAEQIRSWFVPIMSSLRECLKKPDMTVRDGCEGLFRFLILESGVGFGKRPVQERLEYISDGLLEGGEMQLSSEYRQVYARFLQTLDDMVGILGEKRADAQEFLEILMSGIGECSIGNIPEEDAVVFGDIIRTRLSEVRYLFIVGASDMNIPRVSTEAGIITDEERLFLTDILNEGNHSGEEEVELAPVKLKRLEDDQFYLYINLTRPSEKLNISVSELSADGRELNPSYVLERLRALIDFSGVEEDDEAVSLLGDDYGMSAVLELIRKKKGAQVSADKGASEPEVLVSGKARPPRERLLDYYREREGSLIRRLENEELLLGNIPKLSLPTAGRLYGRAEGNISISQIERFSLCPYYGFLQYGLRLSERGRREMTVVDVGNIMHYAFDELVKKMKEAGRDWRSYVDCQEELIALSGRCFDLARERMTEEGRVWSDRELFLAGRFRETFLRNVGHILDQSRYSSFKTAAGEYEFRLSGPVPLKGIVDRVDVADVRVREGGKWRDARYVRIFDYKTGHRQVDLLSLYYGVQIQLPVYLGAVTEQMRRAGGSGSGSGVGAAGGAGDTLILPAGVFYYVIQDGLEKYSFSGEGAIDYRPDGLYSSDPGAVSCMDSSMVEKIRRPGRAESAEKAGKAEGSKRGRRAESAEAIEDPDRIGLENPEGDEPEEEEEEEIRIRSEAVSDAIRLRTDKKGQPSASALKQMKSPEELEAIIDYAKWKAADTYERRNRGDIRVNPYKRGSETACTFCPFFTICGFDREYGAYMEVQEETDQEILEKMKKLLKENGVR